ncbi:ImmA/IrrE family metallo-endopeptidase [Streptomyces sp. NBC_00555]|uniref:ImmA/IrrE family metallo-endopeptidase n=1 Tax=Streptomyces sp. NBC_00555 TaxID=2903662 RepID=UPI0022517440|nr:ImmA/IrrE family metallo-endopeptidase [Streptomyces sp. NBC_00555]MCX5013513.1 ImmA/IrrE family metallo-endopeptidase [Streptomyces sp. NBC_00555]
MTDTREQRFSHTLQSLIAKDRVPMDLLVDLLGSKDIMRDLTSGARLPSLYEATLLGAFFKVSPGLLLQTEEPTMGVSLRLGVLDDIHDVSAAVAHATRLLSIDRLTRDWGFAEPITSVSSFAPSKTWHDRQAGEKTAARLRAYLDLDDVDPVVDLTGFVESLGYPVEYRYLPENVHGISIPEKWGDEYSWIILINANDGWARQRFTLAHELSHVLQQDTGQVIVDRATTEDKRPERIADSFARHFLLPDEAILSTIERSGKLDGRASMFGLLSEIVLTYGISRDAAVIALLDVVDGIDENPYFELCRSSSVSEIMRTSGRSAQWDALNASQGLHFPSERLTQQALNAYSDGLVSLQSVANVIADGDVSAAAQQLQDAGWEVTSGV